MNIYHPTHKHCYKCDTTKPITEFYKDNNRKDGIKIKKALSYPNVKAAAMSLIKQNRCFMRQLIKILLTLRRILIWRLHWKN